MSDSMLRRPLTGLLLLAGAAGGPYVWYETDVGRQGQNAFQSATGLTSTSAGLGQDAPWAFDHSSDSARPWNLPGPNTAVDPFQPHAASVEQLPIVSLAEILRFDISPEWVMSRFPRVSTLLSEMQLDGLRVPLVTGTTPSDMAGTLTYYFDRYKQLKRLTVHATVGDPTRFVNEFQQAYQMSQEPSLGGNLYVIKWNGMPASVLHIAPASVVYADSPYARYQLFLELNQAGLEYGLSQEARQLIEAGRQTRRW